MPLTTFVKEKVWYYDKLKEFKCFFVPPENIKTNALQTWVVVAHYKWMVGIITALFCVVLGYWYSDSPMECIVKSVDAAKVIPDYQEDICLSYPYTYTATKDDHPARKREYALHYRWVHWIFILLIPLYCIPLQCRKYLEYSSIFEHFHAIKTGYLVCERKDMIVDIIVNRYLLMSAWVYKNTLLLHFVTLLVDIVAFVFVDVSLQNRFARLIPLDYPFHRWPQYFNDTISLAFPPFVECKIGPEMMLMLDMEETFGCHLTMMVMFDKIFVILWILMCILTVWTLFMVLYYVFLNFIPRLKRNLIFCENMKAQVNLCLKYLPVGNLMVLNCLRNTLQADEYRKVLRTIFDKISLLNREHNKKRKEQKKHKKLFSF